MDGYLVTLAITCLVLYQERMIRENPSPIPGPLPIIIFQNLILAWSYCAVIVRTTPDWSIVTLRNLMFDGFGGFCE